MPARNEMEEPQVTKTSTTIEPTAGVQVGAVESTRIEKRRSRRFSTTLDLEIYWEDEYGLPCVSPAVVRNVSAGGFGIRLERKPPVGSLLTVRAPMNSMQCVVRHVQPDQGSYLVGVELLPAADGTTPTQSLQRLATALSAARKASIQSPSDEPIARATEIAAAPQSWARRQALAGTVRAKLPDLL